MTLESLFDTVAKIRGLKIDIEHKEEKQKELRRLGTIGTKKERMEADSQVLGLLSQKLQLGRNLYSLEESIESDNKKITEMLNRSYDKVVKDVDDYMNKRIQMLAMKQLEKALTTIIEVMEDADPESAEDMNEARGSYGTAIRLVNKVFETNYQEYFTWQSIRLANDELVKKVELVNKDCEDYGIERIEWPMPTHGLRNINP
jgi:hypothetical protein